MATENLAPHIISRLLTEIRDLVRRPPEGIEYANDDEEESVSEIHAIISGPGILSIYIYSCIADLHSNASMKRVHLIMEGNFA